MTIAGTKTKNCVRTYVEEGRETEGGERRESKKAKEINQGSKPAEDDKGRGT